MHVEPDFGLKLSVTEPEIWNTKSTTENTAQNSLLYKYFIS
jgi:hypothetical protein